MLRKKIVKSDVLIPEILSPKQKIQSILKILFRLAIVSKIIVSDSGKVVFPAQTKLSFHGGCNLEHWRTMCRIVVMEAPTIKMSLLLVENNLLPRSKQWKEPTARTNEESQFRQTIAKIPQAAENPVM